MAVDYPRAALVALALAVGTTFVVAGATSTVAFGAYNPAWDGTSDVRSEATAAGADPVLARDVAAYDEAVPDRTVAVVLSPDRPYSDAEADRIARFVRDGGTLVVAESFGPHGNDLLADVGAAARIDGRQLRDERHHYRSPALPRATNVSNHSLVAEVDSLTLNHGSVVDPNGAEVLVASSPYGYLDEDGDDRLDGGETLDSYPVATVESVGEGRVIVVSDPSVLINAMLERPGNRAFVRTLFAGQGTVLLDHSKTAGFPPLVHAVFVLRGSALLQLVVGIVLVGAIAVWAQGTGSLRNLPGPLGRDGGSERPRPDPVDPETLVDQVASDRPDLDRDRLERLVTASGGGIRGRLDDRNDEK